MNWYYVEQGAQVGPVTREQLDQLFQAGRINGDTLVWQSGQDDWKAYREVFPVVAPPPPLAPTPTGAGEVVCA
jgi:hypothetical protein